MYNIIESNIKFNASRQLVSVLILVEYSKGDIRVVEATNKTQSGYMYLSDRKDYVLFDLLQEVAAYGIEITSKSKMPTEWFNKYFK